MAPWDFEIVLNMGNARPYSTITLALAVIFAAYVAYQKYFHPLARFPGPLVPTLTNVWKAYYTYKLELHERILDLHLRYGPVVRIGPNDLHFWDPAAISIYKSGRSIGKTEFYSAFTTFNPNLFGTQDEDVHALRRRQLAHGFSQTSINDMEYIFDNQLQILCEKLKTFAKTGEVFDLKDCLCCYGLDVLGEIAFSRSFETQLQSDEQGTHAAINDHILLGCVIGLLPFQALSKQLIAWSPIPWMRRLIKSRAQLKATCADCVRQRIEAPRGRKDLLRSLIDAKDPETWAKLTEMDINTEAFAMLVAGSHTTSGTLGLFFWHLMNNPKIMSKAVEELQENVGPLKDGQKAHPINGLEASIPYTMACIRENFRANPVFTMCLWRRVHSREGATIDGFHVPHGTNVGIVNYVLHHNPEVWGNDHKIYDPARWFDDRAKGKEGFLLPFSVGHRFCIGKNIAVTNIIKTITTLLTSFEFESAMKSHELRFRSSGIGEMEGQLLCKVQIRT